MTTPKLTNEASSESLVSDVATRADFLDHETKLKCMLQQFKIELVAEQKHQLERVFPQVNLPNTREKESVNSFKLEIPTTPKLPIDPWGGSKLSADPVASYSSLPLYTSEGGMSDTWSKASSKRFSKDNIFFKCSPIYRQPASPKDLHKIRLPVDSVREDDLPLGPSVDEKHSSIDTHVLSSPGLASQRTSGTAYTSERHSRISSVSNAIAKTFSRHSRNSGASNHQVVAKTMSHAAKKPGKKTARFSKETVQNTTLVSGRYSMDADRASQESNVNLSSLSGSSFRWKRVRRRLKRVVKNPLFDVFCGLLICVNAVLVGFESEFLGQTGDIPTFCDTIQLFLNSWYVIELTLRIYAEGPRKFCFGEEANWNLFDVLLVMSAIADLILMNIRFINFGAARAWRALRLFRIVRTLRIIRQFKYVREFRKMVCSLTSSLSTLLWSLVLVFGVMYSFALWFTQTAAYYRIDNQGDVEALRKADALDEYYTSLSRTLYTLFAAISGGYSWHEVLDPWIAIKDASTVILFFVYISISVFGLMNIVTSVFVESAMSATKRFQDLLLDENKKSLEMYTHHMQRIFHVIDADGGGEISFKEMRMFLQDDSSELPAYLEALGITSSDVWVLFKLLDVDNSGSIDIEEFCEGCMRLKGEARSFDINCMMYESRAMLRHLADFMEFVEDRLEMMERETASWLLEVDRRAAMRMSVLSVSPPPVASRHITPNPCPLTPRENEDRSNGSNQFQPAKSVGATRDRTGLSPMGRQVLKPRIFQESIANDSLACRTRDFQ